MTRAAEPRATPGVPMHAVNAHVAVYPERTIVGSAAVLAVVPEEDTDLNVDGDTDDAIVHLFDRVLGPINLGVAVQGDGQAVAMGDGFAFLVPEWQPGGADLNADGDAEDWVLHVASVAAGVTNLGLAAWDLVPTPDGLAIAVKEGPQGETDLNGDGDSDDAVVHTYDASSGLVVNSGLAVQDNLAVGPRMYDTVAGLAVAVDESGQGRTDLNANGHPSDEVLHLADGAGGFTNLGFAIAHHPAAVVTVGSNIAFDGGDYPYGVHVYDPATATATDLGFSSAWLYGGEVLAFAVSEMAQGSDLNGDGDDWDAVAHVWQPTTGATNLGLAARSDSFVPITRGVAFRVLEESQGGADLNGDGDATDSVVHVFQSGTTTNLGLAGWSHDAADQYLAVLIAEDAQGNTDLNGDGDAHDAVVHVWDDAGGTTNLGLAAVEGLATFGTRAAWVTPEWGVVDLNDNGEVWDYLVYVYEPALGVVYLEPPGQQTEVDAANDTLAYSATEVVVATDLDRDGDIDGSNVLHVAFPDIHPVANDDDYLVPRGGFIDEAAPGLLANDRHPNDEPLTAAWYTNPAHGSLDLYTDGSFTYTHDGTAATIDTFAYSLEDADGALSNRAVVLITVNDPPATVPDGPYVLSAGSTWFEPPPGLLHNDSDADGDPLEVHSYSDAAHGTVTVYENGAFEYFHDGSGSGTDTFGYWATDGWWLSDETVVSMIIEQPPIAVNDALQVAEGGSGTGNVLSNDTDANGDALTAVKITDPAHGSMTLDPDGSFTYSHDGSETTSDSFTYRANDGELDSGLATVSIIVTPVNDAPVAVDDGPYVVQHGGTLGVNGVLDNDTDAENDSLAAVEVAPPAHGTASLNSDGSFTYVHDGSETTNDSFTYKANDGLADSNVATVSITITRVLSVTLTSSVGLVDPAQGKWYLRSGEGDVRSFYYGNPGDVPFFGDWDCDGVETPGLFRTSDAYAYLRNSNTVGIADIRFFFGNPSDVPLAGDFNGDGCDTLSIYRPSEQRFYIMNELGENEGGLGAAEYAFTFGNPGDKPVVGDWDGDGIDEFGLHRESSGFFYYRNTLDVGIADGQFYFGDPGDRFVAGDWGTIDGVETPAVFRPSNTTFYFRWTNTPGAADSEFVWGESGWLPVSGVLD